MCHHQFLESNRNNKEEKKNMRTKMFVAILVMVAMFSLAKGEASDNLEKSKKTKEVQIEKAKEAPAVKDKEVQVKVTEITFKGNNMKETVTTDKDGTTISIKNKEKEVFTDSTRETNHNKAVEERVQPDPSEAIVKPIQ